MSGLRGAMKMMRFRHSATGLLISAGAILGLQPVIASADVQGSPATVPQVSQGVQSPAYINQMSPTARMRPPAPARAPKAAARRTPKAVTVGGVEQQKKGPQYPSVGDGVAIALVEPATVVWPSVGAGTVNR